jgi:hypothetical protein
MGIQQWALLASLFTLGVNAAHRDQRASPTNRDRTGDVHVALSHTTKKAVLQDNLHALEFCAHRGCNPHLEGTRLLALGAVHGPTEYNVQGELVYAVPNTGARNLNRDQLKGHVALMDRGVVPLVDKVRSLCSPTN